MLVPPSSAPELIQLILKRRKIKQSQLAAYIGASPAAVNDWLLGKRRPDPQWVWKLAPLANVSVEEAMRIVGHLPAPDGWDEETKTQHLKPGPARIVINGPPVMQELLTLLQSMTPEEQLEFALPALEIVEGLLRRGRQSAESQTED